MQLDKLIEATVEDPSREPELFSLLLEATLYVHTPKKKVGDRLNIVQFKTPQGILAIPVFTDRNKADFAGRGNVRVVALQGRQLFSATIGANIVINPNDAWCVLYPEEIRALLDGRQLGRTPEDLQITNEVRLRPAKTPCVELLKLIEDSLSKIEPALDAWLTEADDVGGESSTRYVLVIASEPPHHERIARALTLAVSDLGMPFEKSLDITFIEPGEVHKAWIEGNTDCLIYRRAWGRVLDFV